MKTPGDGALPHTVARHLLDQHADRLPDLSGLTVLVPNHRAGQDFARALAQQAERAVLIPPRITPLKVWAESVADGRAEAQARRLAHLHGVLRRVEWLGAVDKWALASELLQLADELSAARLGGEIGSRIRALQWMKSFMRASALRLLAVEISTKLLAIQAAEARVDQMRRRTPCTRGCKGCSGSS